MPVVHQVVLQHILTSFFCNVVEGSVTDAYGRNRSGTQPVLIIIAGRLSYWRVFPQQLLGLNLKVVQLPLERRSTQLLQQQSRTATVAVGLYPSQEVQKLFLPPSVEFWPSKPVHCVRDGITDPTLLFCWVGQEVLCREKAKLNKSGTTCTKAHSCLGGGDQGHPPLVPGNTNLGCTSSLILAKCFED